ncbi:hypothetical protein F511_28936 [Dorcoceras hygrometricum]|uniref:Uncharacterized protein n=1 Tax=Dorcoceras hygrometricum TaxID=472368 RepID=A0A2Z7B6D5_9LAMI|nr:hypothetical protein F511_28936 [Dorcoceras hygrometricum]
MTSPCLLTDISSVHKYDNLQNCSKELNSRLGIDLITKGTKFYLYDTTHNRAATSRSSTSRSQPPKVVWNDRASQEESNATSNVSNNGRKRREFTGIAHGEQY